VPDNKQTVMELSEWCGVNAACEKIPKLQAELEKHRQDVFQTDKGASMDMDKETLTALVRDTVKPLRDSVRINVDGGSENWNKTTVGFHAIMLWWEVCGNNAFNTHDLSCWRWHCNSETCAISNKPHHCRPLLTAAYNSSQSLTQPAAHCCILLLCITAFCC
jgi:hypothetical protein